MIENRNHFTTTIFPSTEIKKKHTFDLYQRQVINWKLECELDGFSREDAYK